MTPRDVPPHQPSATAGSWRPLSSQYEPKQTESITARVPSPRSTTSPTRTCSAPTGPPPTSPPAPVRWPSAMKCEHLDRRGPALADARRLGPIDVRADHTSRRGHPSIDRRLGLRLGAAGYRHRVTVAHDAPRPVYLQIADILRARIESGDLVPDRAIPSESRLMQEYGVARETARKAVRVLAGEGLV